MPNPKTLKTLNISKGKKKDKNKDSGGVVGKKVENQNLNLNQNLNPILNLNLNLKLVSNLSESLATTLKNLPKKPGVYRYYDALGEVLYVGKAKNLKNRVSSYFQQHRSHNQRLALLVSQTQRIEYTEVSSEKEALILEANLIHNLQPRFNIKLKDDSNYIYVRVTADPIPGIFLTRRKYDPKSRYFGPYTKRAGIFSTLRTLRTIFPYCQLRFKQNRACTYTQIKQCDGICVGLEDKVEYLKKLDQICLVLQGRTGQVEDFVKNKMTTAIGSNNFELAAMWRDRLATLKETIGDQKVILPQPQDLDIITLILAQVGGQKDSQNGNNNSESIKENSLENLQNNTDNNTEGVQIASVLVQSIRQGKMVNLNNFLLVGTADIEDEIDNGIGSEVASEMEEREDIEELEMENGQTKNLPTENVENGLQNDLQSNLEPYTETDETEISNSIKTNSADTRDNSNNNHQIVTANSQLAMDYLAKFMASYYAQNPDRVPVLVQCFENVEG